MGARREAGHERAKIQVLNFPTFPTDARNTGNRRLLAVGLPHCQPNRRAPGKSLGQTLIVLNPRGTQPVLRPPRIAHQGSPGERCIAEFRVGSCPLWSNLV